jgi:hypothetical protein
LVIDGFLEEVNMKAITLLYIANATLLLLHEIESAYEKEWEILRLPGAITGFLLLHVPIIILLFYGLLEIERNSAVGLILGIALGIGGVIPFIVHKIIFKTPHQFNLFISNAIIYLNIMSGIGLVFLSARFFA